jgi:AraC-like DNA-binding protein
MNTRPESGRTREHESPQITRIGGWVTTAAVVSTVPTGSLCHLQWCADCVRHALARDIGRHFEELTGLQLHLRRGTDAGSWCPEAERLRGRNPAIPQRCALCGEHRWQAATRENPDGRLFAGACGRLNCRLGISAADGCALSLVIQTPEPQPAARRSSGTAAFNQAVTLLKLVARGLESMLEAEELRWSLDEAQRAQQAVLARDTKLRRVLQKRLPELSGEPALPEKTPQAARLVEQVLDFLQHNYQRPLIGLGEAAASVHRSSSYLSTLFARETGVSLHSYLQELRNNPKIPPARHGGQRSDAGQLHRADRLRSHSGSD